MGCHPSLWILCLCVFFLIFQSRQCLGCMEEDRVALLDLKASSGGSFPSWVDDKPSNCCRWEGVDCSPTTGRVYKLDLYSVGAYFNASVFLPFKDLEYLYIYGSNGIDRQGFEKLSELKNLETLKLVDCSLNSNFLASLSELTSLKILDLGGNHIGEGSSAEISQGFEKLSKLNKLEYLYLEYNALKGDILAYLSGLTSLKELYLYGNLLGEGSLSAILQGTAKTINLKSLEYLDLQSNPLKADVLELLSNLTSLRTLRLGSNSLGYGSSAEIYQGFQKLSKLQKLENLDLSDNKLKSNVLSCLSKLKSLKELDLDYNFMGKADFSDDLSQGIRTLVKLNNLEYLNLAYNDLSNTVIPYFAAFTSILFLNGNRITDISAPSAVEPWPIVANRSDEVNKFCKLRNQDKRKVCQRLPLAWKPFLDPISDEEQMEEAEVQADQAHVAADDPLRFLMS